MTRALLCVALLMPPGQVEEVPADFSVRLELSNYVIDTAAGIYTIDNGRTCAIDEPQTKTAAFVTPPSLRRDLFRWVMAASFFSYPSQFQPFEGIELETAGVERGNDHPWGSFYTLQVTQGGRTHQVQWADRGQTTEDAVRLRELLRRLNGALLQLPEIARLPRWPRCD